MAKRSINGWLAGLCLLGSNVSHADRAALSGEVQAGVALTSVQTAYVSDTRSSIGVAPSIGAQVSYALTNWLELGLGGAWMTPTSWYYRDQTYAKDGVSYAGDLQQRETQLGIWAGPKFLAGSVYRFSLELDAGYTRRSYSQIHFLQVQPDGSAADYGFNLADTAQNGLLLSPALGFETGGDHWVLGIHPRLLVDPSALKSFAVVVPLSFQWSLYL